MVIDTCITIKYYDVQYGRNFAGRLAHFLFRNEEKIASNYRGWKEIITTLVVLCGGRELKYAICQVCRTSVSHGEKMFNTSNLVYHLKSKHKEEYPQYEERKGTPGDKPKVTAFSTYSCKQLSLEESSDLVRIWDINDPHAKRIHQRIVEMIAIDCQPFSIVEDIPFQVGGISQILFFRKLIKA